MTGLRNDNAKGRMPMTDGWNESAEAWIKDMGDEGDYARQFVLDPPMLERIRRRPYQSALDVGCGEGRFCRILGQLGIKTIGIDPTEILLQKARSKDQAGDYRSGRAEKLDFPDASFDLVVSYLTLIDIPDIRQALAEMNRVLQPGGTLLIANLTSFTTAGPPIDATRDNGCELNFCIDHYLAERAAWVSWRGIRIHNWHRPLSTYMSLLLGLGLELRHFDEPPPLGGDPDVMERYRRVPYFLIMEWQKPA
jgi:SAM-dependent methyltransferase